MRSRVLGARTDRAVSPVVGAVLLFALAIALLAIVQTAVVPSLNAQAEFQHHERVQVDVVALDGATDRVVASGIGESVPVEAGLRYPPRMFFVNPPPVTGTVRTTEPEPLAIANASADGAAGAYWNGTTRTFDTRSLVTMAEYHEHTAGATVYDSWSVSNRLTNDTVVVSGDSVVDGRRVTLTTLDGDLYRTSTTTETLDLVPTSAPARTVTVRATDGPITLTLPTELTETQWTTLMDDEIDRTGDRTNDRYVSEVTCDRSPPDPCGQVTITLEDGARYELQLGAVAVGGNGTHATPTYAVDIAGDETSVSENGTRKLVVETRDQFDNPVSGVETTATLDGPGRLRTLESATGADGRAALVYEAPENVAATTDVSATVGFGERPRERVTFDLRVLDLDGSGQRSPTATITAVDDRSAGNQDRYDVTADLADADGDLDRAVFELRTPDGTVLDDATTQIGGSSATVSETLRVTAVDRHDEYRIVVRAVDAAGHTAIDDRLVDGSG
ncbi:hypothetical protein [Halococcoides cellulosivorans]|uniref:Big-1 domain-containing protein n=1 Tax=Halococcoides cellulosivorans TaxID=1679096 RepID=A0A2R4WZF3_9EURY|nr:hypothetical protein [Halococcoides cellulosivorans]AWB26919.1 hypothetical protein HARCEL1_03930 [Halococcoides cellulosivorans]